MRIIFMGTPKFALPSLRILAQNHEVVAVYSAPARPANRGHKLQKSVVHEQAEQLGLEVRTPSSLRDVQVQQEFAQFNADIAVVVAYGLLLPQAILDAPRLGCLNIHPSDLPRWRGAAPIQRAMMAGDATTAICIMQMDLGLDTGAVWKRMMLDVPPDATFPDWEERLANLSADLFLETIGEIEAGVGQLIPQASEGVVYASKIDKSEYKLRFDLPAAQVMANIHGLSPYGYVTLHGERVRIIKAQVAHGDDSADFGLILDNEMLINCANASAIAPLILQREGKNPVSITEFLRGYNKQLQGISL